MSLEAKEGDEVSPDEKEDGEEDDPDCPHCKTFIKNELGVHDEHPSFVYMLTTTRKGEEGEKILCKIGHSRSPLEQIKCENREAGYKVGAKSTKAGSPHYQIELIIGPFFGEDTAKEFRNQWRKGARMKLSRIHHGVKAAKERDGTIIYCRDIDFIRNVMKEYNKKK